MMDWGGPWLNPKHSFRHRLNAPLCYMSYMGLTLGQIYNDVCSCQLIILQTTVATFSHYLPVILFRSWLLKFQQAFVSNGYSSIDQIYKK